jgi:mannose-1-phosphate guanylyltransferase
MGMQPNEPNTGYGYIEQGEEALAGEGIYKLKSFREKPDLKTAITYLEQGGFTWNSGMFLWSADVIIQEMRKYNPDIAEIMDKISPALFTEREQEVVNELFPQCNKISIDYAVMEKTDIAYVMPAEYGWSDLGTWGSLHALTKHDDNNNAVIGNNVKLVESSGCMVRMPDDKPVVIQGLKDCIIAEHDNTLLICQLSEEQRIKEWHN